MKDQRFGVTGTADLTLQVLEIPVDVTGHHGNRGSI